MLIALDVIYEDNREKVCGVRAFWVHGWSENPDVSKMKKGEWVRESV